MKVRRSTRSMASSTLVAAGFTLAAFTGLCASPTYPAVVEGDGALGYYRFNDSLARTDINVNSGSLGAGGNATNDLEFVTGGSLHSIPGAIVGDPDRAAFFDFTTRTEIPFNAAINTTNTQPFTIEAWLLPVSDQAANGMGVLCNRYAQGADPSIGLLGRQGWVIYQRGASTNTSGFSSGPGVGWQFNTYDGEDTSQQLIARSGVPFTLGKWQHLVVVYDPVDATAINATVSMYIDGVLAVVTTNTATSGGNPVPGYVPCTGNHDPTIAVNGQPAMSLGGYNNANSGTYGFGNPWTGGIDEFAWYGTKLSAAQILAHYQNATNANRSIPYATLIKSDNPVVYLRLNEIAPGPDTDVNIGDLRSAGHATNGPAVKHPGTSALAGKTAIEDGSFTGKPQYSFPPNSSLADIPWTAANNPDASVPFTLEVWLRPKSDFTRNGPSPINNRLANGVADRTGWVIYQRDPDASYATNSPNAGESGVGWALRAYTGNGTGGGGDVITGGSGASGGWGYTVGEWMHLVFTWEPQSDNGPTTSGAEQWGGVLTAYTNGVVAVSNNAVKYAANVNPTADARPPTDLAIGSYNLASGQSEEFYGDVDEFVFYSNVVLTADQILTHYMTGTNPHPAVSYAALVMNAGGDSYLANNPGSVIPERTTVPQTYLRFNDPAYFPAANSGSLGHLADGALVLTTNIGTGPAGAGLGSPNPAVPLDGASAWVGLNNPPGLNVSGQITLEAWIKPAATQTNIARIVSHGPPTPTAYDPSLHTFDLSGTLLSSNQVFLRLEDNGATYSVGSSDGTAFHGATAPVPPGVLGGSQWVYLAGTYDGSHWNLYTNGVLAKSVADATGALPVNAEWAIGSTGNGWPEVDDTAGAEGTMEFFSGAIDEVAIYGTALAPATIAAHYYVGQNGPVSLTITESGGVVTVHWPAGTLQQSSTAGSGYADVPGATAPAYSPSPLTTAKYYRVKL